MESSPEWHKFIINADMELIKKYIQHLDEHSREFIYTGSSVNNNETRLHLTISYGETFFEHKGHQFCANYTRDTKKYEELAVNIQCKSKQDAISIFKEFILDCIEFNKNKTTNTVTTYIYKVSYGWIDLSGNIKRNMDTIYFDEKKKSELILDIKNFYASKNEYMEHGIPYTRKYLFEGPPGVGKTSLICSLASILDKTISMINFNQRLDDANFMNAIKHLDKDSFLVLEDIDNFFSSEKSHHSGVSFSSILNILDGFGRKDGMVVFMTTNNYKKLGEVFNRPGRIDYVLHFSEASEVQIKEMFLKFFPKQESKFKKIYELISGKRVSMALIQKFFFDNRKCENILDKKEQLRELIIEYATEKSNLYL